MCHFLIHSTRWQWYQYPERLHESNGKQIWDSFKSNQYCYFFLESINTIYWATNNDEIDRDTQSENFTKSPVLWTLAWNFIQIKFSTSICLFPAYYDWLRIRYRGLQNSVRTWWQWWRKIWVWFCFSKCWSRFKV